MAGKAAVVLLAALTAAAIPSAATAQSAAGTATGPIFTPTEQQNISGVWWIQNYSPRIPVEGEGELPFADEGRALYEANQARLAADPLADEARKFCLPDGVPRILGSPYPFQIIQTPGYVTIIYELNRVVRRVALDLPLAPYEELELFPYFSGHSTGHWEGDTLVIETAGYNDKTFIDATGVPHSARMRTVERMRKAADGSLEIGVTVSDPEVFAADWSARYLYDPQPGMRLLDYTCGEPHRDISRVPGVRVPN